MPTLTLPHGVVHYRVTGPADIGGPPVVFVHGFLVDGRLWTGVADRLATAGMRAYVPDLPLGSHTRPVSESADQTPRGVARQVLAFLEALDLDDVTLVGNDTGGAICQFLLDTDARRIGRVVLTNCDAFEHFPPAPFHHLVRLGRHPALTAIALQPMRWAAPRRRLGYGPLVTRPIDDDLTLAWLTPVRSDRRIRHDVARFCRAVDPAELVAVGSRLQRFAGPVRLVWGGRDRFFDRALAARLVAAFAEAELIEIPDARTFVPLDAPERLTAEILAFVRERSPA